MPCKIFKEHKGEIEAYCIKNRLSFDELRKSPACYDDTELFFQYAAPNDDALPWIHDETPMPTLLEIYLENGKLRFVQTGITHKYLGIAEEAAERTAAKRTAVREPALA